MDYIYHVWGLISSWIMIPLIIFYISVIVAIILENGNPTKTLAWVMVIVLIPIVGLILYYFFGQKFVKKKKIRKITRQQTKKIRKELDALQPEIQRNLQRIEEHVGSFSKVFKMIQREKISFPTSGNSVDLLINGEEMFPKLIDDLTNAKHSIHLEFYIFENDNIGGQVLKIMEQKAVEGLQVRLIVDSFGSSDLVKFMRRNKNSGIEFQNYLPVTFASLANSNYRNHRKVIVIDGEIGYVGGINISDKYCNTQPNLNKVFWRDTAIRFKGFGVNLLQIDFWQSWNQTKGNEFELTDGYLHPDLTNRPGDADIGLVMCDPNSKGPFNMEALLIAIGEAKEKIQLATPYYVPSIELERALIVAASCGVEVELMIPEDSDSLIVKHASYSYLKKILDRGVKVYTYKKGFLHAKTAVIDGKISFVGTVNLDVRSFYINFEIAAVIADQELCKKAVLQFELDKKDSSLLTMSEWKNRPLYIRAWGSTCRLLSSLL